MSCVQWTVRQCIVCSVLLSIWGRWQQSNCGDCIVGQLGADISSTESFTKCVIFVSLHEVKEWIHSFQFIPLWRSWPQVVILALLLRLYSMVCRPRTKAINNSKQELFPIMHWSLFPPQESKYCSHFLFDQMKINCLNHFRRYCKAGPYKIWVWYVGQKNGWQTRKW